MPALVDEIPDGAVDGVNNDFATQGGKRFSAGSLRVFVNGAKAPEGSAINQDGDAGTFTLDFGGGPLAVGWTIEITYVDPDQDIPITSAPIIVVVSVPSVAVTVAAPEVALVVAAAPVVGVAIDPPPAPLTVVVTPPPSITVEVCACP